MYKHDIFLYLILGVVVGLEQVADTMCTSPCCWTVNAVRSGFDEKWLHENAFNLTSQLFKTCSSRERIVLLVVLSNKSQILLWISNKNST